uniref:MCM N-terminal domain-containing protein n=2 Tax=Kalanchoe fedtschenkoi TaxID=63787 RepID=A0A7N0THZ7_KALFE
MKPWRIHSSSASSLSVWKTPPTTSSRARCEFDGPYYEEEIEEMKATASTTMFIDFSHVMRYNDFLHQTISDEYLEFEPYLRSACRDFGWNICMLKRISKWTSARKNLQASERIVSAKIHDVALSASVPASICASSGFIYKCNSQ